MIHADKLIGSIFPRRAGWLTIFLFTTLAFPVALAAQVSNGDKLTPREIAKRSLPSVVLLIMGNSRDETGKSGSGFFVSQDIIATNLHVIRNCDEGVVKIVGQETLYEIVGVVGIDEKNDLALLKVARIRGRAMILNGDDAAAIGDEVYAVGNPQGLEGTFSQGIVSSIRRSTKRDLIQITAPISQGSSGGAVLNDRGEVVGVAVGGIESGQSLNFAIPVSFLRSLIANQKTVIALKSSAAIAQTIPNRTAAIPTTPVPVRTSRMQFKTPDLSTENLFGKARSVREVFYAPEKKFEEWVRGEPTAISMTRYDLEGNREYFEETVYSEKGIGPAWDWDIIFLVAVILEDTKFPVTGKTLYSSDYSNNRTIEEMHVKCADCSSF